MQIQNICKTLNNCKNMFYVQVALGWDCGGKGCKLIRVEKGDEADKDMDIV